MKQPRAWWSGDEKGWIVDVEQLLTPMELQRIIDFTLKVQSDRFITLGSGDRRDECARTITALRERKMIQNIIGVGDKVIYDAYKTDSKKIFT